jgi:hypothetical protein
MNRAEMLKADLNKALEVPPLKQTGAHGGARPGAGRKPKALKYASELAAAEETLMSALPCAIDALIKAAEGGDVSAAKYLLDRAFGRVQAQSYAIAEDVEPPFTEADYENKAAATAFKRSGGW